MTRYLLIFLSLFSILSWCRGQVPIAKQGSADSLANILQDTKSDSVKARANFLLFEYWQNRTPAKAKNHLNEAKRLSEKYPYLRAISPFYEAKSYAVSDPAKCEVLYMKADSLLSKYSTKEAYGLRARAWFNCSVLIQVNDNKRSTALILNNAIPLAKRSGNNDLLSKIYLGVGNTFKNNRQYELAEFYYSAAVTLVKNQFDEGTADLYLSLASTCYQLKKYQEAKKMLDKAKTILSSFPNSWLGPLFYQTEGTYFAKISKLDQALNSFDKGIKAAEILKQEYERQGILLMKYSVLFNQKKYNEAKEIIIYLSEQKEIMSTINNRKRIYGELATTLNQLKETSAAYKWQKEYSRLSDSINDSRLKKDINALEIKFRNTEKQKEIEVLKVKNEQAVLAAKNNRLMNSLMGAIIILLLMVLLLGFWYFRNKKKRRELSYQLRLNEIEQQQQLKFSKAVLLGEEQERRRLARDLHDGLGGMLAGVKINLSVQVEEPPSETKKRELYKIINQVDSSVTELRRIAHNMMPVNLLKFGLKTALKDLCESLMTETTRIDFQAFEIEKDIPEQTQINIYRIVQEMLSNAIKHANATNIILQCSQNKNVFLITQEDNGKGFDLNLADKKTGIGLSNIKNRVGLLKGKIDIESAINEGTTINIELYVD